MIRQSELESCINEFLSIKEMCEKFKCSRTKVYYYLNKYSLERKFECKHPNLNENYFERIDTKEKAYWLGFLFADGFVYSNKIQLFLSINDEEQIDKFINAIGANIKEKKYYTHKPYNSKSVAIWINSQKMFNDLKSLNCISPKSKNLKLIDLGSEELNLAYLLGYFDGDGNVDSHTIISCSLDFLRDLKSKYMIKGKLKKDNTTKNSTTYILTIGAEFVRKLNENYPFSMERKRKVEKEQLDFTSERYIKQRKVSNRPSYEKLVNEVKRTNYVIVGKNYGVSDNTIRKWIRLYEKSIKGGLV